MPTAKKTTETKKNALSLDHQGDSESRASEAGGERAERTTVREHARRRDRAAIGEKHQTSSYWATPASMGGGIVPGGIENSPHAGIRLLTVKS